MDDFVKAIKAELPNSIISWDISAWIGKEGFTKWLLITEFKLFIFSENIFKRIFLIFFRWSYFKTATYIDFIHTSGGQVKFNYFL